MLQDLRIAIRGLRRSPAFAAIAVSSLALGIGANVAIFSFVNAILLKHLPVPQPERLDRVAEDQGGKEITTAFSYPYVRRLAERNQVFDGVLGRFPVRVNLLSSGTAEPLHGEVVTGDYFRTMRVHAALGRLLEQSDIDAAAANPVCVISYSLWQQRFAADPAIIGRKLLLNSRLYRVVGVTQPGFYGSQLESPIDMQLPVSRMGDFMGGFFSSAAGSVLWNSAHFSWLQILARLKPGLTPQQAQSALQPLNRGIKLELADPTARPGIAAEKTTMRLLDGSQGFNSSQSKFAQPVAVLMGIVGLVLLVACVNLANLLLARAKAREKEFAIRLSLGASRSRIIGQLMIESLVIALSSGLLGLLISAWLSHVVLAFVNAGESAGYGLQVSVDPIVLCFCAGLSLLTAVLFGLAPAWQSAKADVLPGLKEVCGERALFRKSLVVAQIALSLVILFAAGLLTRTLAKLETVDLGFQPAHVITLSVDPAMTGHSTAQIMSMFDDMLARFRSQPGINAASIAVVSPLSGGGIRLDVDVPGRANKQTDAEPTFNMISPAYFATLHQPFLAGRDFTDHDREGSPRVAIVNEQFAKQYWPSQNPIGRRFRQGGGDVEVVGLVKTARYQDLREAPSPTVYLPAKQAQSSGYFLLIGTNREPRAIFPVIRRAIHAVEPKIPIYEMHTLQTQIDQDISSERVLSLLSSLFSVLATLLSAIGLYGIIAYAVSRRTREIGVRFAVGAQRSDVAGLFVRESIVLVVIGIAIGLPLALTATRVLKNLLYGLQPTDAPTLGLTTVILIIAALIATLLPVRRAAAIEPLEALRYE